MLATPSDGGQESEREREKHKQKQGGNMGRGGVHAAMTGFVTSLSEGSAERGTMGNYQIRMH